MKKEIIVLGDVEMGGGTYTDDFISDKTLEKIILSLCNKKHPVDLVFNGDTLDFLKCPYIVNNRITYPRHITSEISLAKLRLIYNAHTKVFKAMKKFVENSRNRIFFIIGNHDPDLAHKEVQDSIKSILQSSDNVFFTFHYTENGVHAEHGHQYDFINKVNTNHLFLRYKKKKILNIPWVSFGLISQFMDLKEEYPFMERINPRPALFTQHKTAMKKINIRIFEAFFKGFFYYPVRYFYDPTYNFPKELVREFYRRAKKVHWDVDDIIELFKRKNKKDLPNQKIYVLGHVHKRHIEDRNNVAIIHPDTWRDEYQLDMKTRQLIPKEKRYLQVLVSEDGSLDWDLVEVPIKRNIFHFDDVIRDERKYIKLAAQEEGHRLNF